MVSIRNLDQMLSNPDYKEYYELKQEIIKDYPPQKKRSREQHLEYMKRIGDLMWDINGGFQRFVDSQVSEIITVKQKQKGNPMKGRKPYTRKNDE